MGTPFDGREAGHEGGNLKRRWRKSSEACFQWRGDGEDRLRLHGRGFFEAW